MRKMSNPGEPGGEGTRTKDSLIAETASITEWWSIAAPKYGNSVMPEKELPGTA
jgi:hypothetical protein